ncbi:MAG: CDP-diacylglycerol--glycerol-3-phosphate 3-phosphatidyltransferase [Pseudomonadota bacterium]
MPLTAADKLTLSRIISIAPFTVLFFIDAPWARPAALGLFILAAITDYFDGVLARRHGGTPFGAALDPIADKLLTGAALLLLVHTGTIADLHVLAALAILLREIAVSGLREALGREGAKMPVTRLAKWKTAAQFLALALLVPGAEVLAAPGLAALWAAAGLTVWTGVGYGRATFTKTNRNTDDDIPSPPRGEG